MSATRDLSGASVWCVFRDYSYEGEALRAVFSTREAADAFVEERCADDAECVASDWTVQDWTVDAQTPTHRVATATEGSNG
jgi:hypothetical protein